MVQRGARARLLMSPRDVPCGSNFVFSRPQVVQPGRDCLANNSTTKSPAVSPRADAVQTTPGLVAGFGSGRLAEERGDAKASDPRAADKFPAALGSRPPTTKRADLGDKGVYYRTMVGPLVSTERRPSSAGI